MLTLYLDPATTFWTSLENAPRSAVSGAFGRLKGIRSGIPDIEVIHRTNVGLVVVFVELKSKRGTASRTQIKLREELLPLGVKWWITRSARGTLQALYSSGITFRRTWRLPQLQPWEGPAEDPTMLPKHPQVVKEWRQDKQRYRARKKLREQEAAQLAEEPGELRPAATVVPLEDAAQMRAKSKLA